MKYNFDEIIDRNDTYSIKYDIKGRNKPEGILPLWVADMDFRTPPSVIDAIKEHASHGIFGYSEPDSKYRDAMIAWQRDRFGYDADPDWLTYSPGIVVALYLAIRAYTKEREAVLVQQPVYHPFSAAIEDTGRTIIFNELVDKDGYGHYEIDFEDFEEKIVSNGIKLFLLCNPHNPGGRVWTEDELRQMGDICLKHSVVVVSDEIHQDFVFAGHRHRVFASLSADIEDITITCTSPSKTFNLAGLQQSNHFIANEGLRRLFQKEYDAAGLSQLNIMGMVACKAAYETGKEWLGEMLAYIEGNMNLIESRIKNMPGVRFKKPEGTYLAWINFRDLNLSDSELNDLLTNEAKVWLSPGRSFGAGGSGFMRLNAGCPQSIVTEALDRIERVI